MGSHPPDRTVLSEAAGSSASRLTPRASPAGPHPSLSFATPAVRDRLVRLGIFQLSDMVLHLPLRYEDETRIVSIHDALSGDTAQIEGTVVKTEVKFRPGRQLVSEVDDGSGRLMMRFFNFYPSQQKALAPGARVRVMGEIRQGFFGAEMVHPRFRVLRGELPLPQALTPVYPTTAGLGQDMLRKLAGRALERADLGDTLPEPVRRKLKLPPFAEAVHVLHNPTPDVDAQALVEHVHPAWRRVKFDELLAQQLSMRLHRDRRNRVRAHPLLQHSGLSKRLLASLPFRLTRAQARTLNEIRSDLARPHPMQRLLQGDVGSGKTIVAALAALQAIESGYQAVVMAPTEILAEQHYRKFSLWLEPLGIETAWLTGSLNRKKERDKVLAAIESGKAQLAVGTHALFQEEVVFGKLGLAIVDEQHRFGVHQRLALRMKGSRADQALQPHQLMMSATPIPRTLAMSFYADLDVSVIDEMPPGRTPVMTKLLSETRRDEVLRRVRDACLEGRQAYWVCPLIEESDTGARSRDPLAGGDPGGGKAARPAAMELPLKIRARHEALQLQTAIETYDGMRQTFPEMKVGLVHGRLPNQEKAAVMAAFLANQIQLLVATTVIEVGVDVPNASLMVIEHAERMGLSQLHQLRGRVGRGAESSVCILLYQNPLSDNARERLRIIYENADGFEIARHDLRLRGPGELLGARQSGAPMLRFADLGKDLDLLEAARNVAPQLLRDHAGNAGRHLERWLGGRQELLKV
ncbi:MAG TPA: ATP-dependent DNA helicase RecG [Burkholderiales bacterium]|nr:ATP-dependent DNA helicase RecG [Burkholderiales bacterium]